jgi:hypothetical protein
MAASAGAGAWRGRRRGVAQINRSGQVRSGQVRSGQVRSGQVRSGQVRSGQVRSTCQQRWRRSTRERARHSARGTHAGSLLLGSIAGIVLRRGGTWRMRGALSLDCSRLGRLEPCAAGGKGEGGQPAGRLEARLFGRHKSLPFLALPAPFPAPAQPFHSPRPAPSQPHLRGQQHEGALGLLGRHVGVAQHHVAHPRGDLASERDMCNTCNMCGV